MFASKGPIAPHLSKGELQDLRDDVASVLAPMAAITVEEFTNPAAPSVNAIKLAFATAVTAQVFTGAALNGAVGHGVMSPARNVTVVAAANAGGYLGSATIKGTFRGLPQTEAIVITAAATTAGVKPFDTVTEVDIPIQPDALGSISIGFGLLLGLAADPKSRAGLVSAVQEIAVGVVVTTGVLSATNKTYTPAAAPDGVKDFCVYYEYVSG